MHRTKKTLLAAIGVAGVILAATVPAAQASDHQPGPGASSEPDLTPLVARDLGISEGQARQLTEIEPLANRLEKKFEVRLGSDYAGTWIDRDSTDSVRVTVATTDPEAADRIQEAGARAEVVEHSAMALDDAKQELDDVRRPSPEAVAGWYVSPQDNEVVVLVRPGGKTEANSFVERAGVDQRMVRTVTTRQAPRTFADVRGGDAYHIGGARCSIGFSVEGGFVTAGHCGSEGDATTGPDGNAQGTFEGSIFPGNDMAWVGVNSDWTPTPLVNKYDGTDVNVAGGTEAPVGAAVCRSGSTTGWHCGEITAKGQTVNYAEGSVEGMTETTVCAEPGDSGGSYITPEERQAQGVTSGGSGDCTSGGTTYFQPVQPILSEYGLTLVTEGGGGGDEPPPDDPTCEGLPETYEGTLSGSGDSTVEPDGTYWTSEGGSIRGCLSGPAGTDFDLYLLKWNGYSWETVAQGISPESEEDVSYEGSAGDYAWQVVSYTGSGAYSFAMNRP